MITAVAFNPLKNAHTDIAWCVDHLIRVAGGIVAAEVKTCVFAELTRLAASSQELSMRTAVDAFAKVPMLKEFAERLRKAALPGRFSEYFDPLPSVDAVAS